MSSPGEIKVLKQWHVSPPPNSVSLTRLPLTFFDIPFLRFDTTTQRIFFYELPFSTSHITLNILPDLRQSLSLALQCFPPLVATLVCPARPAKPHILYKDGDYVTLNIAESTGNFNHLIANCPRDVRELHRLVPELPESYLSADGNVEYFPLVALQVIIFPNSGICVGITLRHVLADGKALASFMKSWSSIFRYNKDLSCLGDSAPLYTRDSIRDPNGLEDIMLDQWWTWRSKLKQEVVTTEVDVINDKVLATFLMSRSVIVRLKEWMIKQCKDNNEPNPPHFSAFVVTCAFVWVCLVKSLGHNLSIFDHDYSFIFAFVADCRNSYGLGIPENYFGNCLSICGTIAKKEELMGENGELLAAKAIGGAVRELQSGVLRGAERWILEMQGIGERHIVSVAGSPQLRVYETDFGWGKPKKIEVVHIDGSGSISLAETRDGEGGMEVGVALSRAQMEAFTSIFNMGIENLF